MRFLLAVSIISEGKVRLNLKLKETPFRIEESEFNEIVS